MKTSNPFVKRLKEYIVMTIGCTIYALSFNGFFQPNNFPMGGFTGVAQIVHHFIPFLPVGTTMLLMNVPLMIMGVRKMGPKLLTSTVFAVVVGSLIIDGMDMIYTFPPMDPLLASIYGGVLLGASMGCLMRVDATTGGTELAARLLKFKLPHLSIGKLCMSIDVMVITLYALTFRNVNNALYGIVAMYISSLAMDMVVYGSTNAKLLYIISDQSERLSKHLLQLDVGLTILNGQGAYSGNEKKVLMCAVKRNQITKIKAATIDIDPNSFIIVSEAHEVLGEGFGAFKANGL